MSKNERSDRVLLLFNSIPKSRKPRNAWRDNYEAILLEAFRVRNVPVGHTGMLWFKSHANRLLLETDAMICSASHARSPTDNSSGSECLFRPHEQPKPGATCGPKIPEGECRDKLLCAWDVVSANSADVPLQNRLERLEQLAAQDRACSCQMSPEQGGLCGLQRTASGRHGAMDIRHGHRERMSKRARLLARRRRRHRTAEAGSGGSTGSWH